MVLTGSSIAHPRSCVVADRAKGGAPTYRKIDVDWTSFPFKKIPRKPETRVNIEALEKLVNENKDKLLPQELERAKRTIDYLRNGAPALQLAKLKSCLVPNKLMTADARAAVLKR